MQRSMGFQMMAKLSDCGYEIADALIDDLVAPPFAPVCRCNRDPSVPAYRRGHARPALPLNPAKRRSVAFQMAVVSSRISRHSWRFSA